MTSTIEPNKVLYGLLARKPCLVPTLRGWALLIVSLAALAVIGLCDTGRFLAPSDPLQGGGVMVVEGWAPDYVLEVALAEFNRNHYDKLFVTGMPLEQGAPLSEYKTYAELDAAILIKMGLNSNLVQAVPAAPVRQDRTYAMACSLKRWMEDHGTIPAKIQLITVGPHARRSRLLFEKAFGKGVTIGVTAIPCPDFDLGHWWNCSEGVRTVMSEALAYAYARLLFHPPKQ
jgi:hypothetical protein